MDNKYMRFLADLLGVSEKRQPNTILFCHIPKTAGTSVRNVIDSEYEEGERLAVYDDELNALQPDPALVDLIRGRKKPYRIIYGHFSANVHGFLDLSPYYFTFLREPIVRAVSLYKQLSKPESPYYVQIKDGLTLKEMTLTRVTEMTNNHMTQVISGFRPPPGELIEKEVYLEQAKSLIEKNFFFVGTVETIESDFEILAKKLGWRQKSVPHVNVSPTPAYELDDETKRVLKEHNQLDIELYKWVQRRKVDLNSANR